MTNKFASPFNVESGMIDALIAGSSAQSPCISPSTSRSGAISFRISKTLRIFSDEGVCALPKFECDNNATFGTMPRERSSVAASLVISANCSAVGS